MRGRFGGNMSLVIGLVTLGVLIWEILVQHNAKRWQIWCLLPIAAIHLYITVNQLLLDFDPLTDSADPTWWWVAAYILGPLLLLPYVGFKANEQIAGR